MVGRSWTVCQRGLDSMVFWIDQNNFSNQLLEKVFKKAEYSFYTLTSLNDFSYLVSDLKPQVIVLDFETFLNGKEAFLLQFKENSSLQKTPFIILGEGDIPEITILGRVAKPFDPFEIPSKIAEFLKNH